MEPLDSIEIITERYEPSLIIILALASLILLGLGLQFDAIYSDYLVNKNTNVINCFYSPYLMRWIVQLLGVLGLGLSYLILYKRHWKFLESNLYNLILLSPIVILILDQIMVMAILK